MSTLVDEFADLEPEDTSADLVDTCVEHVSTALRVLSNNTINGLDSNSIREIISVNPTDIMEFDHVSLKMNTNNLYYLGGTLIRDFRIFDFVDEVFPGDNMNQLSVIENIVIPSSVRVINSEAFYNYHYLKNVIFEDNSELEYFGSGAFAYCTKLLKLDLSACVKLERLHAYAFACSGIKTVKLPDSLADINELAFENSKVKEVIVGDVKYNITDFIDALRNNNWHNFWDFETMNKLI